MIVDDDGDDVVSKTSKDSGSFCSMSDLPGYGYDRRPINPDFSTDTLRSKESGFSETEADLEICNKAFSYSDCSGLSETVESADFENCVSPPRPFLNSFSELSLRQENVPRKQKKPCTEKCTHRCLNVSVTEQSQDECNCASRDCTNNVSESRDCANNVSGCSEESADAQCTACGFSVSEDRVSVKGSIYHSACFKCSR